MLAAPAFQETERDKLDKPDTRSSTGIAYHVEFRSGELALEEELAAIFESHLAALPEGDAEAAVTAALNVAVVPGRRRNER